MAKITVIVPIYKVEKYIDRCVESILAQSYGDYEIVLVDDGSPDSCPRICDEYAGRHDNIMVIHKENGGLSDARNAGIDWAMEHSNSEWLAFVDSDDYLHKDYLLTLMNTAEKEDADLVICDFIRVNDSEEIIEKKHSFFDLVTEDKKKLFEILYKNWRIVPAWNKLYRKEIFSELRFAFGKIHEDNFAIHHVLWNCRRAAMISQGLYYYRIRENSIMKTETPKSRLDSFEALIEQHEFSAEHGVMPPKAGGTVEFLNEIMKSKPDFDKENRIRYKALKKRLAKIYFSRKQNRTPRKILGFYCPSLYVKAGSLMKTEKSKKEKN